LKLLFAWRYLKAKKSTNAINIIAWVSMAAIALVTMSMIVVLSVFNGLSDLVKSLYQGFYTDLRIVPASGKVITLTPEQLSRLRGTTGVKAVCLVAEEKALIKVQDNQAVVILKGVDSNFTAITAIEQKIIRGGMNTGDIDKPMLILGYGVESALGILADRFDGQVTAYMPGRNHSFSGGINDFNSGNAATGGTFAIQQDFDNRYAISNLAFVKSLVGLDSNQYSAAEAGLQPGADLETVQQNLQRQLGAAYVVQTRYQQNRSLYNIMRFEKWGVYGIFCLVLLIASFNIVGALTMLVLEKKKDIAVLQSMGAGRRLIRNIFLTEGLLLSVSGIGLGILLGIAVCRLQMSYHLIKLSGGSFLVDYYPVKMMLPDFVLVAATVAIITLLASWWPARKAALQAMELRN
jgi:lipoprotein-releasing system permease protein